MQIIMISLLNKSCTFVDRHSTFNTPTWPTSVHQSISQPHRLRWSVATTLDDRDIAHFPCSSRAVSDLLHTCVTSSLYSLCTLRQSTSERSCFSAQQPGGRLSRRATCPNDS